MNGLSAVFNLESSGSHFSMYYRNTGSILQAVSYGWILPLLQGQTWLQEVIIRNAVSESKKMDGNDGLCFLPGGDGAFFYGFCTGKGGQKLCGG